MKLTKGKLLKLYKKRKQSLKNAHFKIADKKHNTFRKKRSLNLKSATLKKYGKILYGGDPTTPGPIADTAVEPTTDATVEPTFATTGMGPMPENTGVDSNIVDPITEKTVEQQDVIMPDVTTELPPSTPSTPSEEAVSLAPSAPPAPPAPTAPTAPTVAQQDEVNSLPSDESQQMVEDAVVKEQDPPLSMQPTVEDKKLAAATAEDIPTIVEAQYVNNDVPAVDNSITAAYNVFIDELANKIADKLKNGGVQNGYDTNQQLSQIMRGGKQKLTRKNTGASSR